MSYSQQFHRGGRGGGRGGRINWAQSRSRLQYEGLEVQTNAFTLTVQKVITIHQYLLQLESCRCIFHNETKKPIGVAPGGKLIFWNTDVDGGNVDDPSSQPGIDVDEARKRNRSSPLTRRILNQLKEKLEKKSEQFFVHDGSNIAYSPRPLRPEVPHSSDPVLLNDYSEAVDDSISKKRKTNESTSVQYLVFVNVDSDEVGDTCGRHQWFLVSFDLTGTFNYEQSKLMQAALNTALRNSLMQPPSLLWAMGRSPHLFFFPPKQYNVLPPFLQRNVQSAIMPMLGLKPSIRSVENEESFLLLADYGLSYAYNDEAPSSDRNAKVKKPFFPLLNVESDNSATLAGTDVRIANVHAPIPLPMREDIKRSLQLRTFHLRYDKGPRNWQKLQAIQQQLLKEQQVKTDYTSADAQASTTEKDLRVRKPWTEAELEERRYRTRRNIRLFQADDSIIWEPHTYTFSYVARKPKGDEVNRELDEPELITVAEYFWRQYEYRLRYPNMPLLRVPSRNADLKEYLPIEFFFQAKTEVKGMNSDLQVRDALRLHDDYSGMRRIEQVASLLRKVSPAETLRMQFEMALSVDPKTLTAKVLPEPKLYQQEQVQIQDGSWRLPGCYPNPSTLASFAVIDYSAAPEGSLWNDCFKELFQQCRERGMVFPNEITRELFDRVTVRESGQPDLASMYNHFSRAISQARQEFLKIARRGLWDVHNFLGRPVRCTVELVENGQFANVWPEDSRESAPKRVPVAMVNCPSIVFVVVPERNGGQYSAIKFLSNCEFGVQSQVLLSKKRRDSSYYANVAQKLNTKLSTPFGRSAAWRREGNTWLEEVPTMVIGLSTASALGKDGKMTVVGTVCLDNTGLTMFQELRVQRKGPFIAENAMIEIVQALARTYVTCNSSKIPERVVVYRLGGDDGMFEDIIGREVAAIKKAFHLLNVTMKDYSCAQCNGSGCVFCLPKITMVIAQHQHNLILAPRNSVPGLTNVPSGTCVEGIFAALSLSDDGKMGGLMSANQNSEIKAAPQQLFSVAKKSNAFALVAHGGLKGTSKSIIYQWIWNENLLFTPKSSSAATPLTLDELEKLTYFLSFQYGTANKAPRLPSLLQYSARLNNVAIGYVHLRCDQSDNENTLRLSEEDMVYVDASGEGQILRRSKKEKFAWSLPFHPHFSA